MSAVVQGEEDIQVPVPELLGKLLDRNGSDLHLTAGAPPTVRVHGDLERLEEYPPLSPRALFWEEIRQKRAALYRPPLRSRGRRRHPRDA